MLAGTYIVNLEWPTATPINYLRSHLILHQWNVFKTLILIIIRLQTHCDRIKNYLQLCNSNIPPFSQNPERITHILYTIFYHKHNIGYHKRNHTSPHIETSSTVRFPLKFIADCVQNREIASCVTYKIHLKVIFLLILHGWVECCVVNTRTQ